MSNKKDAASITTGAVGNNDVDAKIRTPKPLDLSGQSGFGEQESGTGIGNQAVTISDENKSRE